MYANGVASPTNPNLLHSISFAGLESREYPFTVETIGSLRRIELTRPITFLAGGNGTGKSTLLEAVAVGTERIPISPRKYADLPAGVHTLADLLRFEWLRPGPGVNKSVLQHKRRGFFLRAEDFLDYKRGVVADIAGLRRTAEDFAGEMQGYGLELARGAALGQAQELTRRYGEDLDAMSHGESFLRFFRARFTGPGFYLLDEPDTALSPQSVLGLVAALDEMRRAGAQFIIATHNPILLAFPGAAIFSFDAAPVRETAWDDLEQVRLVRDFLSKPAVYLRHLGVDRTEDGR